MCWNISRHRTVTVNRAINGCNMLSAESMKFCKKSAEASVTRKNGV